MTAPDSSAPPTGEKAGPEPPPDSSAPLEVPPPNGFLYDAFISYSRSNIAEADKIERDLEKFPLPRSVRKRLGRRHLNIFRDINDMTGNRLESGIENKLDQSRTLLVLCSPAARSSKWVNVEINRFAQLRDAGQIVPALIAGRPDNDPGVADTERAFPGALSDVLDSVPLAADLRSAWNVKGRRAKLARGSPWVQLVAGIVGATTDELTARIAKAERRRLQSIVALLTVVLMIVGVFGAYAWQQRGEANVAAQKAEEAAKKVVLVQQLSRLTSDVGTNPQRSLLLAIQAAGLATEGQDDNLLAIDGIRHQLQVTSGQPLLGHHAATRAAAFSVDRRWLATGSDDGLIQLWRMDAADPAGSSLSLTGHQGAIHGLAFSPDGRWLVSGADDGTVRLWQLTDDGATPGPVLGGGRYGAVEALAISPDGQWLAFGTELGSTCLWKRSVDGFTPAPCEVGKDRNPVMSVVFSPKGHWLATLCTPLCDSFGAAVGLWDLHTDFPNQEPRQLVHATDLSEDSLLAVAFSNDETRMAAAYGYRAEVWDLTAADPPEHVIASDGRSQWIYGLALSPDNRWLATGSGGAEIALTDLTQPGRPPIVLRGHGAAVRTLSFSDDGSWLASGSDDATARLWNMTDPRFPSTQLRGQDMAVGKVMFSPGAQPRQLLAVGTTTGDEPNARLWNIPDPLIDPVVLRPEPPSILTGMAVSPDGQWIATSNQGDDDLALWSTADYRSPAAKLPMPGPSHSIAFSPDGRWLAAKSEENGVISLWDMRNRSAPPVEFFEDAWSDNKSLGFSPDSRLLVSGTWRGDVDMWDVSTEPPSATPRFQCHQGDPVRAWPTFSPDGRYVATAANGFAARLWDLTAPDPCASPRLLGRHHDAVAEVAFSGDSRWAATTSFDHQGRLWDLRSGAEPKLVAEVAFDDRVIQTVFSPDDRWVAFGSWDRTVKVLDLANPDATKPNVFAGHAGRILSVAFTPDGRWLATGSEDQTIRLWDPANPGTAPVILRGHEAGVFDIGFVKDENRMVTAALDGTVRVWRLKLADLIEAACHIAGRQLTAEEVSTFMGGARAQQLCG